MQQFLYSRLITISASPSKLAKNSLCLLWMLLILSSCNKNGGSAVVPIKTISTAYTLSANETWSGIVDLQNVVSVPAGKTLTIEAGTRIKASDKAEFDVDGSLISSIVRLYSTSKTPGTTDWGGIGFSGERLEMSYCAISDAEYGWFLYSSSTVGSIAIDHCLFTNCDEALVDFTNSNTVSLTNNTFLANSSAYDKWGGNKKVTIDATLFDSNIYSAIQLLTGSTGDTRLTTINVTKSNFLKESSTGFIGSSTTFIPTNTMLTLSGCYGLKSSYSINTSKGSSVLVTGAASSPVANAGCGFNLDRPARLAAPETAVVTADAQQEIREHAERSFLKNKAHLSN